ncbi:signal recognition particle-docking protein FtsY [Lactiplantibacillus modestisalitolerans]|uniref:Signal recognition particle receptor FtsY n=1 Tax=Lactiplantibacillus modestisalitolerans TaxID=1457219 RepID=A0ABV5WYG2_9LACO|nr:signal recognition particle-docking protein FtsY [Lactiplantibacillus modestisalitolerans]
MGLFSRLKKVFSLPESAASQAEEPTSQVATSAATTSTAATSATSAATSVAATGSDQATSATPTSAVQTSTASASASLAESAPAVSATSAAISEASAESLASSSTVDASAAGIEADHSAQSEAADQDQSEAPLTASEAVARSLAAIRAQAASADAEPVAASTAATTETDTAAEKQPAATSETGVVEAPVESTAPASEGASAEPTEAERYDEGLKKSRKTFGDRINAFLANFRHVDESFFDELEDTLIESDVGYETAMRISDELRDEVKLKNAKSKKDISSVIVEKLVDMYGEAGEGEDNSIYLAAQGPTVILFVGVNGAGKTTTIGKMANMYKQQGKKVLLAACDTFRAGAIQQLQVWGERDGVDVVAGAERSDPASVCFDAVKKAKAEDYDILFVDTAGRLQNKVNLMNELEKIKRVITREIPAAPHEVLLVLDATTGQNALNQAKIFKQSTDVSGIVLTKLDGTARGGIVLAIRNELHLAVKYVGLGEKVTDLRPFNANDFVYGLFKDVITA